MKCGVAMVGVVWALGALGGGEAVRLQAMIDSASEGLVVVPPGEHLIEKPLVITNCVSVRLEPSAVLKAVCEMDYVVRIDNAMRPGMNLSFVGGSIDGNGLADCMALDGYMHYTLRDTAFFNGRKCGLRIGGRRMGYELVANNLYFKCTKSGLAGNVALWSSDGDSHYNDCIVTDYTIGFRFSRAGGNRLTRCHVWGGLVPPVKEGDLPEMLVDSVCFWIDRSHNNSLRDCYADTGKIGFRIDGNDTLMSGCWFANNPIFKLNDMTVIEHHSGNLAVVDGHFSRGQDRVEVYRALSPYAKAIWRDNTYANFATGPGACEYAADDRFQVSQAVATSDEWELLPADQRKFDFEAGAFSTGDGFVSRKVFIPVGAMQKRFPLLGAGRELVLEVKANDADTRQFELVLMQRDGKAWGVNVPLAQEQRTITIAFSKLKPYDGCWLGMPAIAEGELPDLRKLDHLVISYGKWLCPDSVEKAHGFRVESIKIKQ